MKKSVLEAMEQAEKDSVKYYPNKIVAVIDYPRRSAKVVTLEKKWRSTATDSGLTAFNLAKPLNEN